jgi:D-xylose 1-dehydrogenase (NADP+, D-xylono-1,5-lactone-forming)
MPEAPVPTPERLTSAPPVDGERSGYEPVRIGILGAGSWIANRAVIPATRESPWCDLVAVASRGPLASSVAHLDAGGYEELLADARVEAVYIPLPNGMHRHWVERAAAYGKHVLCEKPIGVNSADTAAMIDACDAAGVVLAEAWMTPFGARWQQVIASAEQGCIGDVRHIRADFTFVSDPEVSNYRWDPELGGGALLDVGIYALGASVALWGAEPNHVYANRRVGPSGVDTTTSAWCDWGDGRSASLLASFELPERQRLELVGTTGRIVVTGPAFTGGALATSYELEGPDGIATVVPVVGDDPYRHMLDAFGRAVRGVEPWPRSTKEVLAFSTLIQRVRDASA